MADEALRELLDERYREIAELDEAIGEFNAGCPAQLRLIAKRDALKANAEAALSELARLRATLNRYRYAVMWIASDSWDHCPECRERLEWAHSSDDGGALDNAAIAVIARAFHDAESPVQSHKEKQG